MENNEMKNSQFYEILGKAVNVFTEINFKMQLLVNI